MYQARNQICARRKSDSSPRTVFISSAQSLSSSVSECCPTMLVGGSLVLVAVGPNHTPAQKKVRNLDLGVRVVLGQLRRVCAVRIHYPDLLWLRWAMKHDLLAIG